MEADRRPSAAVGAAPPGPVRRPSCGNISSVSSGARPNTIDLDNVVDCHCATPMASLGLEHVMVHSPTSSSSSRWVGGLPARQPAAAACTISSHAQCQAFGPGCQGVTSNSSAMTSCCLLVKVVVVLCCWWCRPGGLTKPKRIIIVRHGESLGNVDEQVGGGSEDACMHAGCSGHWRLPAYLLVAWLAGWMLAQWVVVVGCPCVCLSVCLHGWVGGAGVRDDARLEGAALAPGPRAGQGDRPQAQGVRTHPPTHPPWAISQ